MKIKDIRNFFQEVDRRIDFPIQVILTGGAAGILYGVERATHDIDFEAHLRGRGKTDRWDVLQKAFEEAAAITQITPQYAEEIDRWSSIVLPDKKSERYEKIGKVEIRILDPALWAIGKLTRFLGTDVSDMVTVLKGTKSDAKRCVRLWGRALGMSPRSPAQSTFRRQVDHFLDTYAQRIWGKRIDPKELKNLFIQAAR